MSNHRALTLLNILLKSRPEFESEKDVIEWLQKIEDFCNISGVFVRFKRELIVSKEKILYLDFDKIFDV